MVKVGPYLSPTTPLGGGLEGITIVFAFFTSPPPLPPAPLLFAAAPPPPHSLRRNNAPIVMSARRKFFITPPRESCPGFRSVSRKILREDASRLFQLNDILQ